MKTLYLLRHAIAVERGTAGYSDDSERPLTPKGRRRLRQITRAMRRLGVSFDLILSSPFARACQTAEIVAKAFQAQKHLELTAALQPGTDPAELVSLLRRLKPAPQCVVLVGHEPDLGEFASLLLAGDRRVRLQFKKAGLCKLAVQSLTAGRCAKLEWLLTPRQMIRLAE